MNRPVDKETAEELVGIFLEAVIAPSVEPDALEIFSAKPNLRVLECGDLAETEKPMTLKKSAAGF